MKITSVTDANGVVTTAVAAETTTASTSFDSALSGEMSKTQSLDQIFQKAAQTYGVDVSLLKAMAKAESNFDANATSSSGAMGIMQLMPGTAKELGVSDAYDPEQNIMGGAKYIASLLEKYDGNVSYALAAYNAGSGNVAKYGGIPPFKETQNYVTKILGYLQDGSFEIPGDKATVSTDSAQTGNSVVDKIKELFTEEDYEAFLQLFLERLLLRLDERAGAEGQTTQQADAQLAEQTDTQAEETAQESDAYIAFRNFGNTNRMAVYLKPSE